MKLIIQHPFQLTKKYGDGHGYTIQQFLKKQDMGIWRHDTN